MVGKARFLVSVMTGKVTRMNKNRLSPEWPNLFPFVMRDYSPPSSAVSSSPDSPGSSSNSISLSLPSSGVSSSS